MLSREEAFSINIQNLKKVHFIGIISAFDSFCAEYLLEKGIKVTASEIKQDNKEAQDWIKRGVLYPGGHDAKYITNDVDLVIFPNGPIPGNPECEETERKGIPAITVGQMLGLISKQFKVIAIAGTHGKTTTSALVVWLLYKQYGIKPNFVIGDKILEWNQSWNFNKNSEYLVIEACEYKKQFLDRAPSPYIAVVTNVDLDHTDFYHSQQEYNSAFSEFISNAQNVVINLPGENIKDVIDGSTKKFNVINVKDIREQYVNIKSPLIGEYNRENVFRACGAANILNIVPSLGDFPGVESRFEYKGNTEYGMRVFLDYAHNPQKIKSCLQGAKEAYPNKKIIFVWEPHSYERTNTFKAQFADSLIMADVIMIPDIFAPVREKEEYKNIISAESFVNYLKEKHPEKEILYTKNYKNTASLLLNDDYNGGYIAILASAGNLKDIISMINLTK